VSFVFFVVHCLTPIVATPLSNGEKIVMSAGSVRYRRKKKRKLREGFTTGTAAAAATKGALRLLLTGSFVTPVSVTLPDDKTLEVPLHRHSQDPSRSLCSVVKDGGDDPDVTHGAEIGARVRILGATKGDTEIVFKGGEGVGRVTKPGLPIKVGELAINPVPRQMIQWAVKEVLASLGADKGQRIEVEIFVTHGETLAKKTLNPRLGIIGGLSILGTTGIVRPLSHRAYKETIESSLSVARAAGDEVVLSTGGKSENFARRLVTHLPEESFVQIADFYGFSLRAAAKSGFNKVTHAVFIGKLIKMAMGLDYTHASSGNMDLGIIGQIALETGESEELSERLVKANTARHSLEIMQETNTTSKIIPQLALKAIDVSRTHSQGKLDINLLLFDYSGQLIFRS
jgi:cobalt-precorrin-5B (C1)-methyltransferase